MSDMKKPHIPPFKCICTILLIAILSQVSLHAQITVTGYCNLVSLLKDSIKSTTSLSGILYAGIDNHLILEHGYYDKLAVKTDNGLIINDSVQFIALPVSVGFATIQLYRTHQEDTIIFLSQEFMVKPLPKPSVFWGEINTSQTGELEKYNIHPRDSLYILFSDDIPESRQWYTITHFSIGYRYGNYFLEIDNPGKVILPKTRNLLLNMKPGQEITLQIQTISNSGIKVELPLVRLKLK